MNNNLPDITISLTEEDQLALLKDSIDLRFVNEKDNEFAKFNQFNTLKNGEIRDRIRRISLPPIHARDLDLDLLLELKNTERNQQAGIKK